MGNGIRMERRRTQKRRVLRIVAIALAVLIVGTILWIWVFPWVDHTFVNRPQIGEGL
ncbi:MAG TPA: hypothetical protein VGB64_15725 [Actinomycetota bacterium]